MKAKAPALAAHTFGFVWSASAEEAFAALRAAGFSHVELMATPPHYDPWREDAALDRTLRARLDGMSLLALDLASNDVNLASPSRDVVDFAVDAYVRTIARAANLGARAVCVGSGRRHALSPRVDAALMAAFKPAFARIHAEAARRGLGVALENHPQGLLAEADAIETFLREEGYDDVRVIYDVANANAIGENPVLGLEALWPRVDVIHLSDSPSGQWRHDPIGSGQIDFAAIGELVRRRGFEGSLALEILSPTPLQDILAGIANLRAAGVPLAPLGAL